MANTEWAFPFADNNGDRMYSDADFAKFFSAWFVNGVFINVGGGLQILDSAAGGMKITLKSGAANINGRVYYLNTDTDFTVPVASSTQDRTDSIVLRLELSARAMSTIYKQSDTSLVRNDSTYEIQLAKINVNKNISEITQSMITDMRTDKNVCGLASPNDPIDVDTFITQFESQFNEQLNNNNADFINWFTNLQNQLNSNQASNLQNQITNIQDSIKRYQILDGYDLDGYTETGDFIINGANNLIHYPVGASNYARLHVEAINSATAIQTLTTTDNIIYIRIFGGNPATFGNWFQQLNATTNQNIYGNNNFLGTTAFNGIQVMAQSCTVEFPMWYGSKMKATRFGNLVTINFSRSPYQDIPSNVSSSQTIPFGFRPSFSIYMAQGVGSGGAIQINPDGTLQSKGGMSVAYPYSYTAVYFTNDTFPS